MKTLRVLVVVVLAVLLPLRFAIASTMACHLAAAGVTAAPDCAGHPHANPGNKCSVCAAANAATPLPSAAPSLPPAAFASNAVFAEPWAPRPQFEAGGPERPPRSA